MLMLKSFTSLISKQKRHIFKGIFYFCKGKTPDILPQLRPVGFWGRNASLRCLLAGIRLRLQKTLFFLQSNNALLHKHYKSRIYISMFNVSKRTLNLPAKRALSSKSGGHILGLTYKILHIPRFGNTTLYLVKEL